MKSKPLIPYHCSFLLSADGRDMKIGICWRRVGNCDYGVYLACEEERPQSTFFKAIYSPKGELESFLVIDAPPKEGMRWEEDHVSYAENLPEISKPCRDVLRDLGNSFYGEWLESFGMSEAAKLLRRTVQAELAKEDKLSAALNSGLPLQVKSEKMPDVLACAEMTERNFLYSFLPGQENGVAQKSLLEAKMRLFFELI